MPNPSHIQHPFRSQRGVTLVELIVILVIVAVLIGLSSSGYFSAKRTQRIKMTIEIAQTYSEAVEQFALDHSGRVPVFTNNDDWHANRTLGPISRLSKSGPVSPTAVDPYVRDTGELLDKVGAYPTKQVQLTTSDSPGPVDGARIVYLRPADDTFQIKVYVRGRYVCSLGNDTAGITPPTCQ